MAAGEEGGAAYTEDGTVDIRGNPVLRSESGGLKAVSFIVVYEVFERMAYYGISSNLVIYLTNKLHQGTVTSANNVTNWAGTIWLTPVLGAYIADAYLGRYRTFVIASAIYLLGMIVLTVTVSIHGLQPPPCANPNVTECEKASPLQLGLFFGSLYILTIGTGGTKANIPTIGADQFDEFDPKEKNHKLSFFNWWAFSIFFGTLFANTVIVYIQDNVGWTLGYGLPTLGVAVSISIFLVGTPFYRHKKPSGSPFTIMARVMVAALRKWKVPVPKDAKELYELDLAEYTSKGKFRIDSTPSLRFLNKASVRTSSTSPWNICPVTQVEETKQMLRMLPVMISMFVPNVMVAQTNTLFIKQGTTLQRTIGGFNIPPASLGAFITASMLISVLIYDRYFVKIIKRWTKNPRGITMLQRMGIGIIIHIFIMLIASFTERYRLSVARSHGLVEKRGLVPLSIFILLPQFILMGVADAFLVAAHFEFYYDQAPENMKSMGSSYSPTSLGIGNFLSSFLLSVVDRITKQNGSKGWIRNNLNASHLDYYYAFFTVLNVLNLIFFLYVAKNYVYKAEVSDSMEVLKKNIDGSKSTAANQLQSVK